MNSLVLFYIVGAVTLVGAVGVVATRNVVYAALLLLLSMAGVAGLYVLLLAEFLALVQVLIYGGAVIIVLLFAIMLTRAQEFRVMADNPQKPVAVLAAIAVFGVLAVAVAGASPLVGKPQGLDYRELGQSLFTQWAIPFEIASLVLLVALIGAIVIARAGGKD